jgi:hypothetical protein
MGQIINMLEWRSAHNLLRADSSCGLPHLGMSAGSELCNQRKLVRIDTDQDQRGVWIVPAGPPIKSRRSSNFQSLTRPLRRRKDF